MYLWYLFLLSIPAQQQPVYVYLSFSNLLVHYKKHTISSTLISFYNLQGNAQYGHSLMAITRKEKLCNYL